MTEAARELTLWLAMPNPDAHREEIFRTLLEQRDRTAQLRSEFFRIAGRVLDVAVWRLPGHDATRALRYLQYGRLRTADKVYFAIQGFGTDEDTLYRVLAAASGEVAQASADFADSYGETFSDDGTLPDGRRSRLAGALDEELSGADLDKAKALLCYGALRPADEIRIATNRVGADETALLNALRRADRTTIRSDYQAAYHENLDKVLDSELSGHDYKRALLILEGKFTTLERIRLAAAGVGTEEAEIFNALSEMTAQEQAVVAEEFKRPESSLYALLRDELDDDDFRRAEALVLRAGGAVSALNQAGAMSGPDVVNAIKMSSGATLATYQKAWSDQTFRMEVMRRSGTRGYFAAQTILTGSVAERLRWAIKGAGTDEDYLFHVLESIGSDADAKEAIRNDSELMSDIESDLSTRDFAKAKLLLAPAVTTFDERIDRLGQSIRAERSWVGALSNTSDALDDEYRELLAAAVRSRADGVLTAGELKELKRAERATKDALQVYVAARDELEDMAVTVLSTAATIVVTVVSGGLAGPAAAAALASQLARAALVNALVKVLAAKAVRGDRFDIFGAEGALAFSSGAVEGIANVLAPGVAKGLLGSATVGAERAATSGFSRIGRELLQEAVQGGLSAAPGSAFSVAADENTWRGGFLDGLSQVAVSTGMGTVTGAGQSVVMHAGTLVFRGAQARWGSIAAEPESSSPVPAGAVPDQNGSPQHLPDLGQEVSPGGGGPKGFDPGELSPDEFKFTALGPLESTPVHPDGSPARVLEIGAGRVDTDLGLPPESLAARTAPDPGLIALTRTDLQSRPGVLELDATKPIPSALRNQDAVLVNNPYGYAVDVAVLGEALRPGGRLIVQGRAEVVPGMRGVNKYMNELLEAVEAGKIPAGYRVVSITKLPEVPSGRPLPADHPVLDLSSGVRKPAQVLGGPFRATGGDPVSWPNAQIVIERAARQPALAHNPWGGEVPYFRAYPQEFLDQAAKYGIARELPDGRFRFYGETTPARTSGEIAGRRLVREWNPKTGSRRIWHESLDHDGKVRIVRPDVDATGGSKVHYMFDADGKYTGSW
ncbi:hypothetical protein Q2K19_22110 [Micromonospora soli]|uniref:hypothetical protein n=1 Tax=Micromonospora sp. NBRC 110009 TaxID=3061627 RepID=UPI002673697F|nr:hypothetical protein [Micromonospora sp. NBRC 110009]WKT96871.1 hypothetical protein Q2K19_22110 [Micromonospora sp. NBRC 110009]